MLWQPLKWISAHVALLFAPLLAIALGKRKPLLTSSGRLAPVKYVENCLKNISIFFLEDFICGHDILSPV